MVLGILAIVFSTFGLLGTAVITFGYEKQMAEHHVTWSSMGSYTTWVIVYAISSVVVFALHLTSGILGVRYSRRAPNMMTLYAILSLAFAIADITLAVVLSPFPTSSAAFDDIIGGRFGLEMLAIPWPIVLLVLANLRRTRESCTR
jgi:hypothetical protein